MAMSTSSSPATPLGVHVAPVAVSNSPPTPAPSQQLKTHVVVVLEATAHTAPVFESLYNHILVNLIRTITKIHKQSHITYGLVLYSDHPSRAVSAAVKYTVTKSMDVFLSRMHKVRFTDGGVIRNAVIDGLAAGVEMLDSMADWGPPAVEGGTTSHLILVANSLPLPVSHSNGIAKPLTLAKINQMMRTRGLKFSLVSARKGLKQLEELVNEVNKTGIEELCIGSHSVRLAFETASQKRNGAKRPAPSASPNKSEGELFSPPNIRPTKIAKVDHSPPAQSDSITTPANSHSLSLPAGNQPTPTSTVVVKLPVTPTNVPQAAAAPSVSPPSREVHDQTHTSQQRPDASLVQSKPAQAPQSLPLGSLNPITAMQQMADQRLSQAARMVQQQRNGLQDQTTGAASVQTQSQSLPMNSIQQQSQSAQGNVSGIALPTSVSQHGLSDGSAMAPTTQNAAPQVNGIQRAGQTNQQQPSDLRAVISAIQQQQQRMAAAAAGNSNGSSSAAGGFAKMLNGAMMATTGMPMGMTTTRPELASVAPAQSIPQAVTGQASLVNAVAQQQPQLQQPQHNFSTLPSPPSQVSSTSDSNANAVANAGQSYFWLGTLSIPVQQAANREVTINVSASASKSANLSDFLPGHWPKRLQISNIFPIRQNQVGPFVKNKGIPMCQMSTVATSAANNNNATREFQYFRKLVDSIGQSSNAALVQFPNAGGAQANQGLILISVNGTMIGMVLMKFPLNIALQELQNHPPAPNLTLPTSHATVQQIQAQFPQQPQQLQAQQQQQSHQVLQQPQQSQQPQQAQQLQQAQAQQFQQAQQLQHAQQIQQSQQLQQQQAMQAMLLQNAINAGGFNLQQQQLAGMVPNGGVLPLGQIQALGGGAPTANGLQLGAGSLSALGGILGGQHAWTNPNGFPNAQGMQPQVSTPNPTAGISALQGQMQGGSQQNIMWLLKMAAAQQQQQQLQQQHK